VQLVNVRKVPRYKPTLRTVHTEVQALDRARRSRHDSPGASDILRIRTQPWSDWLDKYAGDVCLRSALSSDCTTINWAGPYEQSYRVDSNNACGRGAGNASQDH
jgi:hypothetical protein